MPSRRKSQKPFKLRPNKSTAVLLKVLGIDVWKDEEMVKIVPRVPQGRGCNPFTGNCKGDLFFTNARIRTR